MKIVDKILLNDNEIKTFLKVLFEEYAKRQNACQTICWAFSIIKPNITLIQTDFPEVILTGNKYPFKCQNVVQERYLGRLVAIQERVIVFFPGDDLLQENVNKNDFLGLAMLGSDGHISVYGPCNNAYCHTGGEKDENYFYWHCGAGYDTTADRFHVANETINKITTLFSLQEW